MLSLTVVVNHFSISISFLFLFLSFLLGVLGTGIWRLISGSIHLLDLFFSPYHFFCTLLYFLFCSVYCCICLTVPWDIGYKASVSRAVQLPLEFHPDDRDNFLTIIMNNN